MAKDEKSQGSRKINKLLDNLDKQTSDLYRDTYHGTNILDTLYQNVSDELDDAIRAATDGDDEYKNLSNITKLYNKLAKDLGGGTDEITQNFGKNNDKDISNLFMSNDMMSSLMEAYGKSKWIAELDAEFDMILKYMPKLKAALDIKRDCVLCSDSYTKEFLTIKPKNTTENSTRAIAIEANIASMKKIYDLERNVEKWYDYTSKKGEVFIYNVPYDIALDQLLKRKANTSYAITESHLMENMRMFNDTEVNAKVLDGSIVLKCDKSKLLPHVAENNLYLRKALGDDMVKGLSEQFVITERSDKFEDHLHKDGKDTEIKFDRTIDDEIKWEDDDKSAQDGLISGNKKESKVKINGAIVKIIDRSRFIPIYIEDVFFGGYYIEYDLEDSVDTNANSNVQGYNSITSMFNNGRADQDADRLKGDNILRSIAGKISSKINSTFINANVELKKEIYMMLKYNDKYNQVNKSLAMNVVYIPADDVTHLKFKEDPETHRGISDLWDSLVPAKQWIMLNITSTLGQITRGYDRRVYYVKQSLDSNVAQSLLNVISQIKKGNMGIREMESINNIIGVLGRFNDFVIPMGPNGDPPIQFDTMPGQQFDYPQELMQTNEEAAINATEVPVEIVNSSQGMDFAIRYTMTNNKLLRSVLKRQLIIEETLSRLVTNIYKYEFNENVELEVILPPPVFLAITQNSSLIQNVVQYADSIVEIEMANEQDNAKAMFKRKLIRKLAPNYISDKEIDDIKKECSVQGVIDKSESQDDGY